MLQRMVLIGFLIVGAVGEASATTFTEVKAIADINVGEDSGPTVSAVARTGDAANGIWFTEARAAATASETTNRVTTSFDRVELDSVFGERVHSYPVVLSYSLVNDHGALLFSRVFNVSESTIFHEHGSGILPMGTVTSSLTVDLSGVNDVEGTHAFSLWQQTFTESGSFTVNLDGSLDHQNYTTFHTLPYDSLQHGSISVLDVTASFAHVPEPSTWLLLVVGMGACVIGRPMCPLKPLLRTLLNPSSSI